LLLFRTVCGKTDLDAEFVEYGGNAVYGLDALFAQFGNALEQAILGLALQLDIGDRAGCCLLLSSRLELLVFPIQLGLGLVQAHDGILQKRLPAIGFFGQFVGGEVLDAHPQHFDGNIEGTPVSGSLIWSLCLRGGTHG